MYSIMRQCVSILFGWVQLPVEWLWNLITQSGGKTKTLLWLVFGGVLCLLGMVMDRLLRRSDPKSPQQAPISKAQPVQSVPSSSRRVPTTLPQQTVPSQSASYGLSGRPLYPDSAPLFDEPIPDWNELSPSHRSKSSAASPSSSVPSSAVSYKTRNFQVTNGRSHQPQAYAIQRSGSESYRGMANASIDQGRAGSQAYTNRTIELK